MSPSPLPVPQAPTFSSVGQGALVWGLRTLDVMPKMCRKVATLWREIDKKILGFFFPKHIFPINVSFNLIRIW